ncbi:MAG: divergent PAP2 family protein [Clostridia bacterium]|nr:divergent PAP2 family protein [Clostridia bacterium]
MTQFFEELFANRILWCAVIAWGSAQLIKIIIALIMEKKFRPDRIFGDGGMPSGHSATVMTLGILVGWTLGFDSPWFAMATMFAVIVMNDAAGVRQEAGKHAAMLKVIGDAFNAMFTEKDEQVRTEKIKLLVGHTPLQVLFGAILGVIVSVVCILAFDIPMGVYRDVIAGWG